MSHIPRVIHATWDHHQYQYAHDQYFFLSPRSLDDQLTSSNIQMLIIRQDKFQHSQLEHLCGETSLWDNSVFLEHFIKTLFVERINHLFKVLVFCTENLCYLFRCLVWLRLGKKSHTAIQQASLQVVPCLAVHSSTKSLFSILERGTDQLIQHPNAGCGGRWFADKLLGTPPLKNCVSVSTKEHHSQLVFIRHICKRKRINSHETDHSLS